MFSASKMSWVGTAVAVLFSIGCGESPEAMDGCTGNDAFDVHSISRAMGEFPAAMACADFNGDGLADLAVASPGRGAVSVFLGQDDGALAPEAAFPVKGGSAVAAEDADADGWVDLVVTEADGTVQVLRGHGPGGFSPAVPSES
jgi:FG-GAP-like repeat